MARSHARISIHIWSDDDFLALSMPAQWLYLLLFSQPGLNYAGVLALTPRRWASYPSSTTVDIIEAALCELIEHRFILCDWDTQEISVRSFIKNDGILGNPNVLKAAARDFKNVVSSRLRNALVSELPEEYRSMFLGASVPPSEPLPEPLTEGGARNGSRTPSEPPT